MVPYSRLRTTTHDGDSNLAKDRDAGRPGPLISDRIDLPDILSEFDPKPFLSPASFAGLTCPDSLLIPDDELGPTLPRGKLASRGELLKLGRRWDLISRCALVRREEVDSRDIADVFPVAKSGEPHPGVGVDRQIIDRRRRNARERRVITGSRHMPNASSVTELHIPEGKSLRISADDLRNMYHCIPGSSERARSTPVGYAYPAYLFRDWNCWRAELELTDWVFMAWPGLGMGDHNAVDWAQEIHINILKGAGLLSSSHVMRYKHPLPVNDEDYYEGVMIDDRVGLQLYDDPEGGEIRDPGSFDVEAFRRSDRAYVDCGLERHAGKAKRGVEVATFWGIEVEGKVGLAGPPRHKLGALMVLLLRFALMGLGSHELLDMITGQLAYICSFRRPLMAVLNFVYRQASCDGVRSTPFRISTWARNELAVMAFLLPLSIANLRATYSDTLLASDASLTAAGGVAYKMGTKLTEELWRRVPLKLKGQRLLDHLSADLKASGFDVDGESEESDGEVDSDNEEFNALTTASPSLEADLFWEETESTAQKEFGLRVRAFLERDLTCPGPTRCLFVMCFVVIEICGGKGGITSSCRKKGVYCGPVIEIQDGWDLLDPNLFLWLLRLSLAGRVWLMVLEPPCTTFSLARRPALRNSHEPEGFDAEVFKTNEGNNFGLICCMLCIAQWTSGNEYLMEQPAYGHMRFTFWWLLVLHLGGDSIVTPWCGYIWSGPVYLKPTVLMFPRRSQFWKK